MTPATSIPLFLRHSGIVMSAARNASASFAAIAKLVDALDTEDLGNIVALYHDDDQRVVVVTVKRFEESQALAHALRVWMPSILPGHTLRVVVEGEVGARSRAQVALVG